MNSNLYRLVYFSRSMLPEGMLEAEVAKILSASRRNNIRLGVTGALMFTTGCFAQVLEGRVEDVEDTFERIQRDIRHREAVVLTFEPTAERAFSNWSMGYVGSSLAHRLTLAKISEKSGFDVKKVEGERIYDLLRRGMLEEKASRMPTAQ